MILENYSDYKDSGVQWLEEIPSSWELYRIKEIGSVNGRVGWKALTASEYVEKGYVFLATPNIKFKEIDYKNVNYITYERYIESPEIMLREEDILLAKDGSTLGIVNIVTNLPSKATVNSSIAVLRFKNKFDKKYIFYQFKENYIENWIQVKKNGMGVPHLFQEDINKFLILIPPLKEQKIISRFLDNKIDLIDKKVKILQNKKISYEELKKSLINETVCRGTNKDVELKEANANWVGKIPSHWNIGRLKNIFDERVVKNLKLDGSPVTTNILSVMKDIGVINHRDKGNVGNKMSEDITGYKLVYPKDIVVNKMNVLIGSVGISKEFGALSVIYIILKTKSKNSPEYYDYVFRSKYFQKYLRTISTGILEIRECVNSNLFRHQELPQPPKQEQIQIAKYLDEKTSKIDKIISKINDQITTLSEFRKTLINDVVTGKVRVQDE
jgi:type I restriction enzyme S subunit